MKETILIILVIAIAVSHDVLLRFVGILPGKREVFNTVLKKSYNLLNDGQKKRFDNKIIINIPLHTTSGDVKIWLRQSHSYIHIKLSYKGSLIYVAEKSLDEGIVKKPFIGIAKWKLMRIVEEM